MLRAALAANGEFEIVALTHPAELIDFIVIAGDQRAHFALRHLQAAVRRIEIGANACDVAAQLRHIFCVRFSGQLLIHVCAERRQLFIVGHDGRLVLFASRDQVGLGNVQFVGHDS